MKSISVLFLFFIFVNFSASQDRTLAGFENIRWGEAQDLAKVKMLKFERIKLNSYLPNTIRFENGIYLNENVLYWDLHFGKKGFDRIVIDFSDIGDQTKRFEKILKILTNTYGTPAKLIKSDPKKCVWSFKGRDSIILQLSLGLLPNHSGNSVKLVFNHISE